MDQNLTEDMLDELLLSEGPMDYIEQNDVGQRDLTKALEGFLEEKGLKRIDVIHEAQLNETFGYQIFIGTRRPSRNKVLQIALAMGLGLRDANRLLQAAEVSPLYCKDRRDAIIIFSIEKGCTLAEANEALYKFGEDTIC